MKKAKICSYCKEPMEENFLGRTCDNCLKIKELKQKLNFQCKPPKTCFYCPYPDCVQKLGRRTEQEIEYLKCADLK